MMCMLLNYRRLYDSLRYRALWDGKESRGCVANLNTCGSENLEWSENWIGSEIPRIQGPEHVASGDSRPRTYRHRLPPSKRHRRCPKRRHIGPSQAAGEKDGQNRAGAEAADGCDVWRGQERLRSAGRQFPTWMPVDFTLPIPCGELREIMAS